MFATCLSVVLCISILHLHEKSYQDDMMRALIHRILQMYLYTEVEKYIFTHFWENAKLNI